MPVLYAGTSGFAYASWKPDFYPGDLSPKRFLEHYASRLNCVESNYTFRRTPSEKTLESWIACTPEGFVFPVKAHQRITHVLRLRDDGQAVGRFLDALEPLRAAGRLGPVLFQLPPKFRADAALLGVFVHALPRGYRYAFEFRDPTWFSPEIYDVLRKGRAALCLAESDAVVTPEEITADFVYFRLRKPAYSEADLQAIEDRARKLLASGRDVYLIFKHEESPEGPLNAERALREITR